MSPQTRRRARPLPDWLAALATMLASLVGAALVLKLGDARLAEPFDYRGDANSAQMIVKAVLEHGWYQHNNDLGYPFGQDLGPYGFVSGDNLQIVLILVVGLFTNSAAVALNVFFLLGFPLAALTAYLVLRAWRLSQPASAAAAVLFALAPYHFLQGELHVFISAYYAVPLGAYLIVETWRGRWVQFGKSRRRIALVALICVVVGSAHVYYAAFTVLLLLPAAIAQKVAGGPIGHVARAALPALLVTLVVGLNHLPNILWSSAHSGEAAVERTVAESEQFGLKAAAMALPVTGHRIGPLADLRARYDRETPSQTGDGDAQALGLTATLGVLGLAFVLLAAVPRARPRDTEGPPQLALALGATAATAFVLGTVGGGSALFALLGSPQLRAWARISILIAFCGLAGVALAIDWFARRRGLGARSLAALAAAVAIVGVLEQTTGSMAPDYEQTRASWTGDAAFVAAIERRLPAGAAVFQLPYQPFPEPQIEGAPPAGAAPYDAVRQYLHSKSLKWSWGEVKGLHNDWQFALADGPAKLVPSAAVAVGFKGLVFDRGSYLLRGAPVEKEVAAAAGRPAIVSTDGRLAFYDLRPLARRLIDRPGATALAAARDAVLNPPQVEWQTSALKSGTAHAYRLAFGQGAVQVRGPAGRTARLLANATLTGDRGTAEVYWPTTGKQSFSGPGPFKIRRAFRIPAVIRITASGAGDALFPDVASPFNLRLTDPSVVDERVLALSAVTPVPTPPATLLTPYGRR